MSTYRSYEQHPASQVMAQTARAACTTIFIVSKHWEIPMLERCMMKSGSVSQYIVGSICQYALSKTYSDGISPGAPSVRELAVQAVAPDAVQTRIAAALLKDESIVIKDLRITSHEVLSIGQILIKCDSTYKIHECYGVPHIRAHIFVAEADFIKLGVEVFYCGKSRQKGWALFVFDNVKTSLRPFSLVFGKNMNQDA
ncbi:hypothetical protein BDQ12DRAFT_713162 [Crucibulum laeve]|uniref:Uncharacterized protein n=1 Tax=Crucibulum laeve TaxID=68775 RepID=A0A5C3LZG8_9AGAR|nr:hypothetical protein BDQ12DRAFT_713162 [Crucibulum laeve]